MGSKRSLRHRLCCCMKVKSSSKKGKRQPKDGTEVSLYPDGKAEKKLSVDEHATVQTTLLAKSSSNESLEKVEAAGDTLPYNELSKGEVIDKSSSPSSSSSSASSRKGSRSSDDNEKEGVGTTTTVEVDGQAEKKEIGESQTIADVAYEKEKKNMSYIDADVETPDLSQRSQASNLEPHLDENVVAIDDVQIYPEVPVVYEQAVMQESAEKDEEIQPTVKNLVEEEQTEKPQPETIEEITSKTESSSSSDSESSFEILEDVVKESSSSSSSDVESVVEVNNYIDVSNKAQPDKANDQPGDSEKPGDVSNKAPPDKANDKPGDSKKPGDSEPLQEVKIEADEEDKEIGDTSVDEAYVEEPIVSENFLTVQTNEHRLSSGSSCKTDDFIDASNLSDVYFSAESVSGKVPDSKEEIRHDHVELPQEAEELSLTSAEDKQNDEIKRAESLSSSNSSSSESENDDEDDKPDESWSNKSTCGDSVASQSNVAESVKTDERDIESAEQSSESNDTSDSSDSDNNDDKETNEFRDVMDKADVALETQIVAPPCQSLPDEVVLQDTSDRDEPGVALRDSESSSVASETHDLSEADQKDEYNIQTETNVDPIITGEKEMEQINRSESSTSINSETKESEVNDHQDTSQNDLIGNPEQSPEPNNDAQNQRRLSSSSSSSSSMSSSSSSSSDASVEEAETESPAIKVDNAAEDKEPESDVAVKEEVTLEETVEEDSPKETLPRKDRKEITFTSGWRRVVKLMDLINARLVKPEIVEKLESCEIEEQEVANNLSQYLNGEEPIAGLLIMESGKKMSLYDASNNRIIRRGTAVSLLEAQAATGSIINPYTGAKMNVAEAVKDGLIDRFLESVLTRAERAAFGFTTRLSDKPLSLFEAMKRNLVVESHGIRLLEAQIATGGLIDPRANHRLPVEVAFERGLFDERLNKILEDPADDTKGFFDPNTNENLTYLKLIERCVTDDETSLKLLPLYKTKQKKDYWKK